MFNWGDGVWWIMGSYYLREWHMRWFTDHVNPHEEDVHVADISDSIVGFSLSGPNSRQVLASLAHEDVTNASMPFMSCRTLDVGLIRARVGRLSVCGELGYEINCHASEHIELRHILLAAGAEFGLREIGYYALNSLRLEKSFGIWSAEYTQRYTAGMTGLDRWIDHSKPDFIGKAAALKERESNAPPERLVTLEIDTRDADASGFEPVWQGDRRIGFITSGGYGHVIGKSLAMALVEPEFAETGTEVSAHVVAKRIPARVMARSPYDPAGKVMRM